MFDDLDQDEQDADAYAASMLFDALGSDDTTACVHASPEHVDAIPEPDIISQKQANDFLAQDDDRVSSL
eukprot:12414605-Karenia_brevis.AAC.1